MERLEPGPAERGGALRVLWALSRSDLGGVPLQALALLPFMEREGIEVHLAAPGDGALAGRLRAGAAGWIAAPLASLDPRNPGRLRRYCRARGIALLHSHGKGAGLAGRLAARPCVRRAAGAAVAPAASGGGAAGSRAPAPLAVHAFRGFAMHRLAPWQRGAYLALERRLARRTAALIAVSPSEAEALAAHRIAPREKIEVIPNGIGAAAIRAGALSRAQARAELGLPADAWVAGTLARADRVKGLERFVAIAEGVGRAGAPGGGRAIFAVIGIGPADRGYAAALRAHAERRGAPLAWVPARVEGWRWLPAFDLYLSTSLSEGLPNAPLEAIALGLPVLLSDVQGNRDVVPGGSRAMLFAPGDPGAAVARIAALRAGEWGPLAPPEREALLEAYSLERQAQSLARLYRRLA